MSFSKDNRISLCRERLELGDRITWSHCTVNDTGLTGEVCRVDVVHGKVVQLVVFTDYWEYVKVSGNDLSRVRKVMEPRNGIEPRYTFREGDVAQVAGREFIVSEVLPNGFVLPEPSPKYPQAVKSPEYVEYLEKSGKRRRLNFKRWPQDEYNPYICRVPIPHARKRGAPLKPASFDRPTRTPVNQKKRRNGKVKRRPVLVKASPKRRPVKKPIRTPVR